MPNPERREPVRLVNVCLLVWALVITGLCVPFAIDGDEWPFVGFLVAAVTAGSAIWGLGRGRWVGPMFVSLYVLAIGAIGAGAIDTSDVWAANGVLGIIVLSVGAAILHRLDR